MRDAGDQVAEVHAPVLIPEANPRCQADVSCPSVVQEDAVVGIDIVCKPTSVERRTDGRVGRKRRWQVAHRD